MIMFDIILLLLFNKTAVDSIQYILIMSVRYRKYYAVMIIKFLINIMLCIKRAMYYDSIEQIKPIKLII